MPTFAACAPAGPCAASARRSPPAAAQACRAYGGAVSAARCGQGCGRVGRPTPRRAMDRRERRVRYGAPHGGQVGQGQGDARGDPGRRGMPMERRCVRSGGTLERQRAAGRRPAGGGAGAGGHAPGARRRGAERVPLRLGREAPPGIAEWRGCLARHAFRRPRTSRKVGLFRAPMETSARRRLVRGGGPARRRDPSSTRRVLPYSPGGPARFKACRRQGPEPPGRGGAGTAAPPRGARRAPPTSARIAGARRPVRPRPPPSRPPR